MKEKSLCADDLEIINKNSDMVYRMAYSLLKHKYDAEDIYQEVFLRYLKKKPTFENEEHEKAWFLRVTINLCKNIWKSTWRQKVIHIEDEEPELWEEDEHDEIIDIVKQLPQKYRMVIHLFYYEELSVEDSVAAGGACGEGTAFIDCIVVTGYGKGDTISL